MKNFTAQSVVWKEGGRYVAQCLNVDVSSFGKTQKQAIAALQEALELYFDGATPVSFAKVQAPVFVETRLQHA